MTIAQDSRFAPKRILCPLDLSGTSRTVLEWANLFAEAFQAKLDLLHTEWPEYPPYFLPSQEVELESESEQRRKTMTEEVSKLARETLGKSVSFEIAILEGYPVEAILARASSEKVDMIVMGSHGRSGFSRLRLGSVAESVVRTTTIATLVTRAHADAKPAKIERVLCPVSLTKTSHTGLKLAAELAETFRAQLFVLHATEEGSFDLEAKHRELCQWIPAEIRDRCDLVEVVRHGTEAEQILLAAREKAVDLIVMEAGRRPILDVSILGTTAERVVRHADPAVLLIS